MKKSLSYIDRHAKTMHIEKVYGNALLQLVYPKNRLLRYLATPLLFFVAKLPFISWLYGKLQNTASSQKKIQPFVERFNVDLSEFSPPESYATFDAFFTRKLCKKRPMPKQSKTAILPADARYQFIETIDQSTLFKIKENSWGLDAFLQNSTLAAEFEQGSMILARLAPMDYHRFHFPVDGKAHPPIWIDGNLLSVNPLTYKNRLSVFSENRRMLTEIESDYFGKVLMVEIGATCVGLIHQTFQPGKVQRGDEKGFFAFGASAVALIFQKNRLQIDTDLLELSKEQEVFAKFGDSLGKASH